MVTEYAWDQDEENKRIKTEDLKPNARYRVTAATLPDHTPNNGDNRDSRYILTLDDEYDYVLMPSYSAYLAEHYTVPKKVIDAGQR